MERAVIKTLDDLRGFTEEFIEQGRSGVIKLPVPVLNINEWHANPNLYALLLGMDEEDFVRVSYFTDMVVTASDVEEFKIGDILDEEGFKKYESLPKEDQPKISVAGGAEAVKFLLEHVDIQEKLTACRQKEIDLMKKLEKLYAKYDELGGDEMSFSIYRKATDTAIESEGEKDVELSDEEAALVDTEKGIDELQLILSEVRCELTALRYYKKHGTSSLIINEINLFPVDLRGALKEALPEIPYAIYDIERQYCRVLSRAERLNKLMEIGAPDIILRNEKRSLQECVDALINNGARGTFLDGRNEEYAVTSLTDIALKRIKLV